MSTYPFDKLFRPRSVAVIGASMRERSLGRAVLRNLREGGFAEACPVMRVARALISMMARSIESSN